MDILAPTSPPISLSDELCTKSDMWALHDRHLGKVMDGAEPDDMSLIISHLCAIELQLEMLKEVPTRLNTIQGIVTSIHSADGCDSKADVEPAGATECDLGWLYDVTEIMFSAIGTLLGGCVAEANMHCPINAHPCTITGELDVFQLPELSPMSARQDATYFSNHHSVMLKHH